VECGLKACICRKTKRFDFPPKDIKGYDSHRFQDLIGTAGLQPTLAEKLKKNEEFKTFWEVVAK